MAQVIPQTSILNGPFSWQITQDSATIDNKFHWKYEKDDDDGNRLYSWVPYMYRQRMTRTYTKLVNDPSATTIPSSPYDPDGLVEQGWKCVNQDLSHGFGENLATYSETYEKLGSWMEYDEEEEEA